MKKIIVLFAVMATISFKSFGGDLLISPKDTLALKEDQKKRRRKKKKLSGMNVKILPALYWGTLGFSIEKPLGESLSLNFNAIGTLGRLDGAKANYTVRPEAFSSEGVRAEVMLRYYFKNESPEGLYANINLAYNDLFYFDGTTRPYTLHNKWKQLNGLRLPSDFERPNPLSAGIGLGYQLTIIPERIIADVYVAAQAHQDFDKSFFLQAYIAPTIGYKF